MRYRLDGSMEFWHSGNILNCASGLILNPLDYIITSNMLNIKSGNNYAVTVIKNDTLVEFSVPAGTLAPGLYEWHAYLRNDLVSWQTPTVLVEVR